MIRFTLLLLSLLVNAPFLDAVTYQFSPDPIDVVIPCTYKDVRSLEKCIAGIRKNCQVRRVIVVSKTQLTDSAEWFDEASYPFSKDDVAQEFLTSPGSRLGWYYQQLLKLYAPLVIPEISSNVLVLDADTVFLNPVEFLDESFAGLYNIGQEYNSSYFKHIERLTEGRVHRVHANYSGITHHMLFQRCVLDDLFKLVEQVHQQPFWKAFCQSVDPKELTLSGASEYELYFNFVLSRTDQISIRKLLWQNVSSLDGLITYKHRGFHYVSCHNYEGK